MGKHGGGGEAHMLGEHGGMVVAAAPQIGHELRIGKGIRIDGLQLPVHGDRGWFAFLVPVAKLLPPDLQREHLFGALKALGNFSLWRRQHLLVAEALDIAHPETAREHPVKAREVACARLEGRGMGLLKVARQRSREVHRVLLPRSWPWRIERKLCRDG